MNKLREILEQNIAIKGFKSINGEDEYFGNLDEASVAVLEAAIKAYIAEIIGDYDAHRAMKPQSIRLDEDGQISREWTDQDNDWKTIITRDQLRAEQRERAGL